MAGKSITQFLPLASLPVEECERHYVEVHVPFAQAVLRDMPHVVSYHTNRADRQLDIAGGWRQRPTAWRYVILRFDEGPQLGFPPGIARMIEADHENCLRRLQRCTVREEVLVDRRCGQVRMAKYLVAVDRRGDAVAGDVDTGGTDAVAAEVEQLTAALHDVVGREFCGRLLIANHIIDEAESKPGKEEGQGLTDRLLPSTDKIVIFEMYFDDYRWGDTALAGTRIHDALRSDRLDVRVYQVDERCGLDRRG